MKKLVFSLTKKDFEFSAMRAGGPGGQHQNKTNSAVRIVHRPSGTQAVSRTHKSQAQNKKEAFRRLISDPKFILWRNAMVHELSGGKSIEQRVEESMVPENLKVETRETGKWVETFIEISEG